MTIFNFNGLTPERVVELVSLSNASYFGELPPTGWTALSGDEIGFEEGFLSGSFDGTTFVGSAGFLGAPAAQVFQNGTELTVSFRGTDTSSLSALLADFTTYLDIIGNNNYINAFDSLLEAVADYAVESSNNILSINVVGHSLGAAAANILRSVSSTEFDGVFDNANFLTVASPKISSSPSILNVGFENDWVFKAIPRSTPFVNSDFFSTTDNIVLFDDDYSDENWPGLVFGPSDVSSHDSSGYIEAVQRILSSSFYSEMTRDSVIVVVSTDNQVSDKDVTTSDHFGSSAFFIGRDQADDILGGQNVDYIEGFAGDDSLNGGGGDDTLSGGSGVDLFLGTPGELDGDTITDLEIGDRIGISGETVTQSDVALLSNRISINADSGFSGLFGSEISINLTTQPVGASLRVLNETLPDGGSILEVVGSSRDIALLIDISLSMDDDIASVKAQAEDIIAAAFENGADARISIITFNTVGEIFTVLEFTSQENIEDRISAALTGVASVEVSDGGLEPAYGAILSSLNGDAGAFRTDAGVSRQIIVFTDEPPFDTELRDEAIAKAQNLNANVDDPLGPVPFASQLALTSSASSQAASLVASSVALDQLPTQIFTVLIGDDSQAEAAYEELASATGGAVVSAANADDVVDAILEVVNLPNYTINTNALVVDEGDIGTQTVQISISRDVSDNAAVVDISQSGTADNNDVSGIPSTVSFGVGIETVTFDVDIIGDAQVEPDETLVLSIGAVSEAATFSGASIGITITNDDAFIASGPVLLDAGNSNVNIDGQVFEFVDFGGIDTYTILPNLLGDVVITDNNLSGINLPAGLVIEDARFLSDGLQLQVNGNTITFLGNPDDFAYVFGGTPLDASVGSVLRYDQVASAFGTSLPAPGQPATSALFTGTVRIDGTIEGSGSGGPTTISSVAYFLLDQAAELAGDPNRLNNIDIDGLVFGVTDESGTTTQVVLESDAANVAGTHQGFVNSLQGPLQALISDGTLPIGTTLRLDPTLVDTTFLADGSQSDPIPAMVLTVNDGSTLSGFGFSRIDDPIGIFDVYGRLSDFTETFAQMASVDELALNDLPMLNMIADSGDIGSEHELSPFDYATPIEVVGTSIETVEGYA
ncbi:VWA domain-containing protein [Marivita hallyeonensis]|uniref:von Willebrand factor type A domain-containing protein n=1 Tax=Marivita hallyeonensis TaxID=996342 RepID=A0A1M5W0G9_9RHOB|nr:VWA domain-containing protein [Marivita hallyeonensis]SHH80967.1 von Willebrand factor type A domain-containing protein [Marivita hallyeonensis]